MTNRILEKRAIEGGPKAVSNRLTSWPQFDDVLENVIRAYAC